MVKVFLRIVERRDNGAAFFSRFMSIIVVTRFSKGTGVTCLVVIHTAKQSTVFLLGIVYTPQVDVTSIQFFTPFTIIDIIPTKHLIPGAAKASLREAQ